MKRLEFTPRARRDIEEIWDYSFNHFGAEHAEAYIRDLQRAAQAIAQDPRRGRACDDIRAGYRKFLVGSHVLFFRVTEERVIVVRILHQRMDFERHLP
jgi:toxin ParE1/3/4